jgi:aspartyl-tRNA(Asn)/glutamyl-tRNA(Gln) amidotransferase subunit C
MALSITDVEEVAALARLRLTDDEKHSLRDQLSAILENIEVLNRVDTSAIPPTAQVIPLRNVLREDEVRPSLQRDQALANAPDQAEGFFAVPAVLGSETETA